MADELFVLAVQTSECRYIYIYKYILFQTTTHIVAKYEIGIVNVYCWLALKNSSKKKSICVCFWNSYKIPNLLQFEYVDSLAAFEEIKI